MRPAVGPAGPARARAGARSAKPPLRSVSRSRSPAHHFAGAKWLGLALGVERVRVAGGLRVVARRTACREQPLGGLMMGLLIAARLARVTALALADVAHLAGAHGRVVLAHAARDVRDDHARFRRVSVVGDP